MPIPTRRPKESRDAYIARAMSSTILIAEYPDPKQRYAVIISKLEK